MDILSYLGESVQAIGVLMLVAVIALLVHGCVRIRRVGNDAGAKE
jgi:Sec-independent protein translocase protein TatA